MHFLAYIDPGLGALIWQSIVAAFVGFLFYLRQTRRWIVSTFQNLFGRRQKSVTAITTPKKPAAKVEAQVEVR